MNPFTHWFFQCNTSAYTAIRLGIFLSLHSSAFVECNIWETSCSWHPCLNCSASKPASAFKKSPNTDKAEELSPENNSESTSKML